MIRANVRHNGRARRLGFALALCAVIFGATPAAAFDVADCAPDFKPPSTSGAGISLRDFSGKNFPELIANRTFFLIDQHGVIRRKRILENPATTVVCSDKVAGDIEDVIGTR